MERKTLNQEIPYFIDGAAINGVSGGPVVYKDGGKIHIVGSISAYIPNRATGEPLPGLSVAHQVTLLHAAKQRIKDFDDQQS